MAIILFYLSSTYLYVCIKFAFVLDFVCDMLHSPLYVSNLVGDSMVVTLCIVLVLSSLWDSRHGVDLIILDMLDADIILVWHSYLYIMMF